jgi:hypothetical protein
VTILGRMAKKPPWRSPLRAKRDSGVAFMGKSLRGTVPGSAGGGRGEKNDRPRTLRRRGSRLAINQSPRKSGLSKPPTTSRRPPSASVSSRRPTKPAWVTGWDEGDGADGRADRSGGCSQNYSWMINTARVAGCRTRCPGPHFLFTLLGCDILPATALAGSHFQQSRWPNRPGCLDPAAVTRRQSSPATHGQPATQPRGGIIGNLYVGFAF